MKGSVKHVVKALIKWTCALIAYSIKLLPDRMQINVKQNLEIIRKMDYKKKDIQIYVDSLFEHTLWKNSCKKEPETVEWIESLDKDGVLYDIGACVGVYSIIADKFHNGKLKIYAFEPAIQNFPKLVRNIMLNKSNITPFQIALSDTVTIDSFNYHDLESGSAKHTLDKEVFRKFYNKNPLVEEPVIVYKLDDFIKQFKLHPPTYVKIDVDGKELSVLKGMEHNLGSVKSIIIEMNEPYKIRNFLENKGFKLLGPIRRSYNSIFIKTIQKVM